MPMIQQSSHTRAPPATSEFARFASAVATRLNATERGWLYASNSPASLFSLRPDQQQIRLDLAPFAAVTQPADAAPFFDNISTLTELIEAYRSAKDSCTDEPDQQVHSYAEQYLEQRVQAAHNNYSNADAQRIATWVKSLDRYAAVKSIESLLDSHDNLELFHLADQQGWQVHFDHLALRCGSSQQQHAETMVQRLQEQHGYVSSHLTEQQYYLFDDGWNAYPLYKMLDNGQVIRLFIDQSSADAPLQIIQHWNRCYGFNPHHLALRFTRIENKQCHAVPLLEVITALSSVGLTALTPTGFYTHGLLEQVFLKPHRNSHVPKILKAELASIDVNLTRTIENGKLIELVSRRELPTDMAQQLFTLYNIASEITQHPVSAPVYPYFLPAQAAHVIKTSVETQPQEPLHG